MAVPGQGNPFGSRQLIRISCNHFAQLRHNCAMVRPVNQYETNLIESISFGRCVTGFPELRNNGGGGLRRRLQTVHVMKITTTYGKSILGPPAAKVRGTRADLQGKKEEEKNWRLRKTP